MKAPDKIYLNKYMFRPGMMHPAQYPADEPEFEYIRKDALLEWANERREAVAKEVVIREGVRLGADAAFEELIDKLNEM